MFKEIIKLKLNLIHTEIWLEPKRKVYGPSYTSGRIHIALARGNRDLNRNDVQIGNSLLESGVIMGLGDKVRARTVLKEKSEGWYRQFHNFTVIWEPGK